MQGAQMAEAKPEVEVRESLAQAAAEHEFRSASSRKASA
jgi:hypothetical protein